MPKSKIPDFKPEAKMPALVPYNIGEIDNQTLRYDTWGYKRSDKDFRERHPGVLSAEKLFEKQVLKDQKGESELMPALQNEFMRSGIENALGSLGDDAILSPGSAGEANVARNLGLNIMQFQDRNRNNRQKSLALAEELFPRRQFGLSGADAATISMLNTQGANNWNQANYADQIQQEQFNHRIGVENMRTAIGQSNANAAADAQEDAANKQAAVGAATAVASIALLALVCWIARAIYGTEDNSWRVFRNWLLRDAPSWLRKLYIFIGPKAGAWLERHAWASLILRPAFDWIVSRRRKEWECALA